jgi:AraC-like DNA-binding protein
MVAIDGYGPSVTTIVSDHHGRLLAQVDAAWRTGRHRLARLPGEADISVDREVRTAIDRYDWDGLHRGGDPSRPFAVLQYTLDGWGCIEDRRGRQRVDAGRMLVAIVPGAHRYWLPPESPRWDFIWVIVQHPFAISLLERAVHAAGPALDAPADGPLAAALLRVFAMVRSGRPGDPLTVEQAVIELGFACARQGAAPADPRTRMLAQVAAHLDAHGGRFVDVAELATAAGSTRSAYTRRFRRLTGTTPASHVLSLRIEAVRRALVDGDATLEAIAARTGFADANHLCKAFRRRMHLSPGAYRRQMRGGT